MRLTILLILLGALPAWAAIPNPVVPPTNAPALSPEAEALVRRYRMDDRLEVKLNALRSLGRMSEPKLVTFFEREFEKLDSTFPDDARFSGEILKTWAARPSAVSVPYLIYEGLFHEDPTVVRACAQGLALMPADTRTILSTGRAEAGRDPADEIAVDLITRLMHKPEIFHALEKVLVIWSGKSRPGYQATDDLSQTPDAATAKAGTAYWKQWFEERFQQKFVPVIEKTEAEKSDQDVYLFLLTDSFKGGDAAHGAKVYAALRCNRCHGNGVTSAPPARMLGPDLAGVGRRLTRTELADALVYPSRQIAPRYKTVTVTLKDSTVLKGYISKTNEESITLTGRTRVRRLVRNTVESLTPQTESIMPSRTLNRSSLEEIRDLVKFLER